MIFPIVLGFDWSWDAGVGGIVSGLIGYSPAKRVGPNPVAQCYLSYVASSSTPNKVGKKVGT